METGLKGVKFKADSAGYKNDPSHPVSGKLYALTIHLLLESASVAIGSTARYLSERLMESWALRKEAVLEGEGALASMRARRCVCMHRLEGIIPKRARSIDPNTE